MNSNGKGLFVAYIKIVSTSTGVTQDNHDKTLSQSTVFVQIERKIIMNKTYVLHSKFLVRLTIKMHLPYANKRWSRNKYRDCDNILAGHACRKPHGLYRMSTGDWWNCDREVNSKACSSTTLSTKYLTYTALAYKLGHRRWKQTSMCLRYSTTNLCCLNKQKEETDKNYTNVHSLGTGHSVEIKQKQHKRIVFG